MKDSRFRTYNTLFVQIFNHFAIQQASDAVLRNVNIKINVLLKTLLQSLIFFLIFGRCSCSGLQTALLIRFSLQLGLTVLSETVFWGVTLLNLNKQTRIS